MSKEQLGQHEVLGSGESSCQRWHVVFDKDGGYDGLFDAWVIMDGDRFVASIEINFPYDGREKADADFLVAAANLLCSSKEGVSA